MNWSLVERHLLGQNLDPSRLSWEQLGFLVEAVFNDEPPTTLEAGFAGQHGRYEGLTVNALERIFAAGAELVAGDWQDATVHAGSAAVHNALAQLRPGVGRLILPASTEPDFQEQQTTLAFQQGKVLFMRNWPVAYGSLEESDDRDDAAPVTAAQARVGRLPGPSVLGGQNLAIASGSPHPAEAQALIEFITAEPQRQFRDISADLEHALRGQLAGP